MNRKIKTIIADDNYYFCRALEEYLQNQSYLNVVSTFNDGRAAWEGIQLHKPDLIILDLVMPNLDGLGIMERINSQQGMIRPKIIVQTAFGQEGMVHKIMESGADCFMLKPYSLKMLEKRIFSLTLDIWSACLAPVSSGSQAVWEREKKADLINKVTKLMHLIGIPAHVKGYQFIREAMMLILADGSLLRTVGKDLYSSIAKEHGITPGKVERGIRHAIEMAWERGQAELLTLTFGGMAGKKLRRPGNVEFIKAMINKIKIDAV